MAVKTLIQLRRDTEANWAGKTLADGEIGVTNSGTNAGKFKIGDGTTVWGSLPYANPAALVTAITSGSPLLVTDGSLSFTGGYARFTGSTDTLDGTNPYPKLTVKSGATGPATPSVGDVWIKY